MPKEHFEKTCLLSFSIYFHFRAEESIDLGGQGPLLENQTSQSQYSWGREWASLKNSLKWQQVYISCYKEPAKDNAKNKVSWRNHYQNRFCNTPKSLGEVSAAPALGDFHIPSEENGWCIICERLVLVNPRAGFASPGGMKYMLTPLMKLCKSQVVQLKQV